MPKIKPFVKNFLYELVLFFFSLPGIRKYRDFLLSTWFLESKRNKLDNFIYPFLFKAWITNRYYPEKNPDKRILMQENLMGNDCGVEWAKNYHQKKFPNPDARYGTLDFYEAYPWSTCIPKFLDSSQEKITIFQIGSSSGTEIAWLAKTFPQHNFIGTDIYEEIINWAEGIYNLPNLQFATMPGHLVPEVAKAVDTNKVIIFSSASATYMQPEHIDTFFKRVKSCQKEIYLFMVEPAREINGQSPSEIRGSRPRSNFSYAHNYKYYSNKHEVNVTKCNIIHPYTPQEKYYPNHQGTVHYYFEAQNRA